jgi:histone-lysine N-methyltransferase SETD2
LLSVPVLAFPCVQLREEDVMLCACAPGADGRGCGEECLNRTLFYECDSRFCPCGEACGNQRFQRQQYCRIEMRRAGRKGHGLFAGQRIRKGDFIVEYVGEVLEERAYALRKEAYAEGGQRHFYFMSLGGAEVIDACARGNLARFVNHSCAPNCETQKWMVAGELCIGMFATEDVEAGAELTFDYNFERYGDAPMRCLCGAKGCRGWIGGAGDGAPPSDEEADSEPEDDPAPVMLASDGAEHAAFERAAADHAAAEGARDARRERERAERVARRKAAESRVRRSSSTPGGGAKSRRSSAGVGGTPGFSAGVPFMKRSEVERRLDELLSPAGALKNKEVVKPLLRLFALALAAGTPGNASGDGGDAAPGAPAAAPGTEAAAAPPSSSGPAVSARDMSLLLEAVVRTSSSALQRELLASHVLAVLNMALQRLSGVGREILVPVLRKLLRVMDGLPIGHAELEKLHSAGGGNALLSSLHKLMTMSSADAEAARRARELCIKLASMLPNGGAGMPMQQQQQQQQGMTPASGMRPHDVPGRGAMMGTPMPPFNMYHHQQQQQQRTPGGAGPMYQQQQQQQQQYPPPPPPPQQQHMGWPGQQYHGGGGGMDDRAAKRPRWGAGMHDNGNGHGGGGGGALPPPPPLPQEDYPQPPPLPPPPPRDMGSMGSMELAPVRSPTRNGGGEAEERGARGSGGASGAGGNGGGGGASGSGGASGGGGARPPAAVSSPGGGPPVAPVYVAGTPVPWPTKADVSRLPGAWDDPFGETFKVGVLVLVAYRLGKYRQADHPLAKLVRPGADAMAIKLASKVVDRERRRAEEHRGRGAPPAVACEKLSDKIRVFVSEHVHAMEKAARAGGMVR